VASASRASCCILSAQAGSSQRDAATSRNLAGRIVVAEFLFDISDQQLEDEVFRVRLKECAAACAART